jgi:hypothetical protein
MYMNTQTKTQTETDTLEITTKIEDIQNRLPAIYADFSRNYAALQSHPENSEYQHAVAALKDNLAAEENTLRGMLAGHRSAYNASVTRVSDYGYLYNETLQYIILMAIALIAMFQFIFSIKSYRLTAPTLSAALGGFIVYLVIVILYAKTYGASGWLFVVILIPLIIYAFSLFVEKKCGPGAPNAAAAGIK